MANERLRAAMERHSVAVNELATLTEKDPKTVSRWLGGRVPHPRQRFLVAKKLKEDEEFLWPGAKQNGGGTDSTGEIVSAYPYRSNLPTSTWWDLIARSTRQIDLLGYTLATPGASAPLLHLRRLEPGGFFSRFAEHFEKVWATTKPISWADQ